jgi:hypothetical protein
MKEIIPKIKKEVNAFLVGEEGKITKKSLLTAGAFLGAISVGSALLSNGASAAYSHVNSLTSTFDPSTNTLTGSHGHHGSHSSHGNHCSWL